MDRLTLNRRQKTTGDKIDCIPAGDGLPIWTTIPLDAKLPMMQNPKGSVVLYTTKLGEPKHRCKQEYDFDLRDPNGQYITNEYQPLHDPHLRSHFNTQVMRRHLIKKGFISEDGKVLCSLKEFNQYRQYLRHIYFLEIAKERKEELDGRLTQASEHRRETNLDKQMSRGSLVRRRLQQQRDRDLNKLKRNISDKACTLERRLKAIREEMTRRERKQREEAERRQMAVFKNQQENEHRNLMMLKRWRNRDRLRTKLLHDRETQRKMQAELKCIEKWTARKEAQTSMMEKTNELLKEEEEERMKSIGNREQTINKKREKLEKKIERQKQLSREEKQKRDDHYFKRLEEKLASGDYRIWTKRKERKKSSKKTFLSTWKLQDVLRTFEVPDKKTNQADPAIMQMLNDAIDTAVHIVVDQSNDLEYEVQARSIVDDVIAKVKNDLYPQLLQLLDVDNNEGENDAMKSKSVRFSSDEAEIKTDHSSSSEAICYLKPVTEHVLTPVASQLEIAKLEAEAILGSPELSDKTSSVTFVETLLLRLLDDLNSGKLSKDEIMKLASYSMDIIQSAETDNNQDDVIVEVPEEAETEGPYLAASSSSVIAKKMVDFTLSKILSDVQTGSVHPEDIASLTVSLMDNVAGCDSGEAVSDSDSALEAYIDSTLQRASSTAKDKREDSPVCDAMLDDFMVSTLKKLIHDLEEEVLTKEQIQHLAASVTEETKCIIPRPIDNVEKQEDVQTVLRELLLQLQSGDFGIQTMYQVVFAIVCAYNTMKSPSKPDVEKHFTELLNDLLLTVEQKTASGELGEININIVHEATTRLSQTKLDSKQIEEISSCLVDNQAVSDCHVSMSDDDGTKLEKASLVISNAKLMFENGNNATTLQQGMENVAEAVINVVHDPCTSPTFVDVFTNILQELKRVVENIEGSHDMSAADLQDLIDQIASNSISQDVLLEIASSVVRVIRSPVKSESSFAAGLAVKCSLNTVLDDFRNGTLDNSFIQEMIGSLKVCLTAAESRGRKTPSFINSLSSFLKNVLDQLTFKVQTGELTEDDIAELSQMFKSKISHKDEASEKEQVIENKTQVVQGEANTDTQDITNILHYIQHFVDNTQLDELNAEEAHDIGKKLIKCGQKLVKSFRDNASVPVTPCTDTVADNIVEEVIKNLQLEIESGILSTETLKDVTKVIIDSTSTSEIANEVVANTFNGIQRDINRGYQPANISSVPSLNHSPSASTVASHIVMQTIDSICKDILLKGIPPTMISSLASTIIADLSGENPLIRALPEEFQRFKPTIVNIIQCLKEDKVSESCAESMFCLILEKYKTCVLESQGEEQDAEDLSSEDLSLINTLVVETLDNVRRSVTKGRMEYKAFSIPSIPHSEDSSIIAIDLIDTCLENIKRSVAAEKAMPEQPKHDLVDFILEILTRLQSELVDGTISNLSMAHFYKAISDDSSDMKSLEANAAGNLSIVVNDIRRFREHSEFVHRIIETYLMPDKSSDEVFSDPLKAIEVILVNVSSEILTKFVKATLQTILMEIRSDSTPISEKTPSAYVLRSASSIIAENVIKEVVSRIRQDMNKSIHKIHGTVCKQDIERAASRIVNESPRVAARQASPADSKKQDSKHSVCSTSKEVEDLVLETLHNIVSNLRLEQSMKSLKSSIPSSSTSLEIEDFVLSSLQSIIIDQQDIRSQIEIGVEKTTSKYGGSSIELVSGESKEAMTYVSEVLQNVLREMKEEVAIKEEESEKGSDMESCNVQTMILECLQKALSDTLAPDSLNVAVELYHQDDVRKILLESVTATIANIRDDKFSNHDMDTMYKACKRFFEEVDPEYVVENVDTVTPKMIMELMDQVKVKIEALDLDNNTFLNISTQLATLGMDSTPPDKTASDHTTSELSIPSSFVSELVRDVITRISAQLNNELSDKALNNPHVKLSHSDESDSKHVSQMASMNSGAKNDVNYNRRISISTVSSHTSVQSIASSNEILTGEKITVKPSAPAKEKLANGNQRPTKCNQKCQISPSTGKKLMKRPSEARPVIRQSQKPAKTCPNQTKTTKSTTDKVRNMPCVQSQAAQRHNSVVHYTIPVMSPKSFKDKSSSCQAKSNRATLTPAASKNKSFTKSPNKVKEVRLKSPLIRPNEMKTQKGILDTEKDREQPLELRSLCGAHRTKLSYKDVKDLTGDN